MNEPQGPDHGMYPVPTKKTAEAPQITPEDQIFNVKKPTEPVQEKEAEQEKEEVPEPITAVPTEQGESKRGKGKRGKDRAPRKKRVMTQQMLDNLKKARDAAREKRLSKKKEKKPAAKKAPAIVATEEVKVELSTTIPEPPELKRQHAIQLPDNDSDPDFEEFMSFQQFKQSKARHKARPRKKAKAPAPTAAKYRSDHTVNRPVQQRRAPPVQRQSRPQRAPAKRKSNSWHSIMQGSGLF